jgi:catechol 2,3-dioxygenase-like lactoylglutathione lyase family enzyme
MTNTFLASFLLLALLPSAQAQLPDMYRSVGRILWVVKDLDRVTAEWQKLGFSEIRRVGELPTRDVYRGKALDGSVAIALGRIGDVQVAWIQPLTDSGAYAQFLASHGDGVFSLAHRVSSPDALVREIERLHALGVAVLQRTEIDAGSDTVILVQMDTEAKGAYSLGLIYMPPDIAASNDVPALPNAPKLAHIAFVARDIHAVSVYWSKLGFPEMSFSHGPLSKPMYRDSPGRFDMELGWQHYVQPAYEWIQSLKGPSVYEEYLKAHGQGVQHIGVPVNDMDKAVAAWQRLGYAVVQSGGWGQEGKPGSGRFAYLDTAPIGGLTVELLWSFPESPR